MEGSETGWIVRQGREGGQGRSEGAGRGAWRSASAGRSVRRGGVEGWKMGGMCRGREGRWREGKVEVEVEGRAERGSVEEVEGSVVCEGWGTERK